VCAQQLRRRERKCQKLGLARAIAVAGVAEASAHLDAIAQLETPRCLSKQAYAALRAPHRGPCRTKSGLQDLGAQLHQSKHRPCLFATFLHSLFLPQVFEQRKDLARNSFDLPVALLVGADEIERDVANACRVKGAHAVGYLLC
jgi:hypothetical protein